MKYFIYILFSVLLACEKVVEVDLPEAQNLIVAQGWVTDFLDDQPIRLTESNGFSDANQVPLIENAQVIVQSRTGNVFTYSYKSNGYYHADIPYKGKNEIEYRLSIVVDGLEIQSEWDKMPKMISIANLQADSFEENDPEDSDKQITVFYPKIIVLDPVNQVNYYRWVFYKDDVIFNTPESITIQNDRLFNGNFIPNNFQLFDYDTGNKMTVQLESISADSYNYLSFLKSQITTQGTPSGTTPAIVTGNLFYLNNKSQQILGYFGTVSSSIKSFDIP